MVGDPLYEYMSEDNSLSLVPDYKWEWDDGSTRTTGDIEDAEAHPDAVEKLAELGRADDECEVTLRGMYA